MRTLIIKSSEWLRNQGQPDYKGTLHKDGQSCCLGIDALAQGVPIDMLINFGDPEDLAGTFSLDKITPEVKSYLETWGTIRDASDDEVEFWEWYLHSKDAMGEAISVNDNKTTTDEEKIEKLREIFAKVGIKIDWRPNE